MIEGIIGKKLGMTQIFDEEGNIIPVTVIQAGPCVVVQRKTEERDGYSALQLGFLDGKPLSEKKVKKPMAGHFKRANVEPVRVLKEVRITPDEEVKEGDKLNVSDVLKDVERVHVTGVSKGKGFQGVMKRFGFHGGRASHGSMFHRAPGSIGATTFPAKVWKGKGLPGHMGNEKVTVKNLKVVRIDGEKNLILVKGAVPGANGEIVIIKNSNFRRK